MRRDWLRGVVGVHGREPTLLFLDSDLPTLPLLCRIDLLLLLPLLLLLLLPLVVPAVGVVGCDSDCCLEAFVGVCFPLRAERLFRLRAVEAAVASASTSLPSLLPPSPPSPSPSWSSSSSLKGSLPLGFLWPFVRRFCLCCLRCLLADVDAALAPFRARGPSPASLVAL